MHSIRLFLMEDGTEQAGNCLFWRMMLCASGYPRVKVSGFWPDLTGFFKMKNKTTKLFFFFGPNFSLYYIIFVIFVQRTLH